MNAATRFIVLIERVTQAHRWDWLKAGALLALSAALLTSAPSLRAQTAASKIAADLQQVISAPTTPTLSWAKDVSGTRMVKLLLISNSTDPDLAALRADVIAKGGSVYFRYVSVAALSAMLPANQVAAIAARADVQGVSPNRLTARTASTLEYATGALTSNVRTYSSTTAYTGLDGTGVGIAVLDSGVEEYHGNLAGTDGKTTRVKAAVDFQKVGDATALGVKDWTAGVDASASLYPSSATMATYESNIASLAINRPDRYGHGTHVASVAAGRGYYQTNDPIFLSYPAPKAVSPRFGLGAQASIRSTM